MWPRAHKLQKHLGSTHKRPLSAYFVSPKEFPNEMENVMGLDIVLIASYCDLKKVEFS